MPGVVDLHSEALSIGLPIGPFPFSMDVVTDKVKQWARNPDTGGGGFPVSRSGKDDRAISRGVQCGVACSHRRGHGCKWMATYEHSLEGFVLVRANLEHSGHDLTTTEVESMAMRGSKTLPPELYDLARAAADAGQFPSQIDTLIRTRAAQLGLSVSWTLDYIAYQFPSANLALDAENILEYLDSRRNELGCGSEIRCNEAGYITKIFVVLDDAEQEWSDCADNVLLFDVTWGTNRSGMKLGCFTTVGKSGHTVILAFALLDSESVSAFQWAFKCFATHFKRAPSTIFTDEGATILTAVATMQDEGWWKDTHHMFCTYHIAKNFYKHVHPAVRDPKRWRDMNSAFWRLAKYSDSQFNPKPLWDWIVARVMEEESSGDALVWLESLWVKREHWLACLTWQHCSWGIHSTQRAESIHSAIKKVRLANKSMSSLIEHLVKLNEKQRDRHLVDDVRASIRTAADSANMSPLLEELSKRLTPHAFDICKAQAARALMYTCARLSNSSHTVTYSSPNKPSALTPTVGEDGKIICWQCNADFGTESEPTLAGHQTSLENCSCQFYNCFRLPCRHMFLVHIVSQQQKLHCAIGDKWLVTSSSDRHRNLFNLRSAPPPVHRQSVSKTTITAKERRAILFDEFSCLIDTASRCPETFQALRQCLPALQYAVQHSKVLPIPVHTEVEAEAEVPDDSPDVLAFKALLGDDWVVDKATATEIVNGGLVGRSVAHKYGVKIWYRAVVTEVVEGDASRNYVIKYESGKEDDFCDAYLGVMNQWTMEGKASRYQWVPIKAAGLSNVRARATPQVLPPPSGRGRKPTARGKPPAGPMSGAKQNKKAKVAKAATTGEGE